MSRYAVTTPGLERWFKKYNASRPYEDRVKPFNFVSGFQASSLAATGEEMFIIGEGSKSPRKWKQHPLRPIAPYSRTSKEASTHTFDRDTGQPIPAGQLKTYSQALAQYHLRPEAKFENGDYFEPIKPIRKIQKRLLKCDLCEALRLARPLCPAGFHRSDYPRPGREVLLGFRENEPAKNKKGRRTLCWLR
jgi:hypothetical protein